MIDGVKILCKGVTLSDWLNSPHLNFFTPVNIDTGEIQGSRVAKYKGLKFIIASSTIHKGQYNFIVRGSLHKYHNNGKHNADTFTHTQLTEVLDELKDKFNIQPENAILQNIEIGVNINPPIPVYMVLRGLVAYKSYNFSMLKIEGVKVGKQIQQQQTRGKIYDKAKEYNLKDKNILRVEIAVKKMSYVKPYNVKTLSDLYDIQKVRQLATLLTDFWNDVIFYDKQIRYKDMTNFEQKKILYLASPRNWVEFNRKQRYKAKQYFKRLLAKYGITDTYVVILYKINTQIEKITAQKGGQINQLLSPFEKSKKGTNYPLEYTGKMSPFNKENKEKDFCRKNEKKGCVVYTAPKHPKHPARKCVVCRTDISHKKTGAKYCSKQCNNVANGKRRTQRRQKQRATETKHLTRLIKLIPKKRLWLLVSYKTEHGTIYTDYLHQTEITTTPDVIRKITRVEVTGHRKNARPITLTTLRAKALIRSINHKNIKENETSNTNPTRNQRKTQDKSLLPIFARKNK